MSDQTAPLKVRFFCESDGVTRETLAEPGELLTQIAYRAGVTIQQTCGGTPSCTDCKVTLKEGGAEALDQPQAAELRLLGNVFFITKERLACQAHVLTDATFFVPTPPKRKEKFLKKSQKPGRNLNENFRTEGEKHGKEKQKESNQKKHQKKGREEN